MENRLLSTLNDHNDDMSGCEIWEEIVDFSKVKEARSREKLGLLLENGVASHDTFQRVFQLMKPTEFEASFKSPCHSHCRCIGKRQIPATRSLRRFLEAKTMRLSERYSQEDKEREKTRYFITSLIDAETLAKAVRAHWGVENSLHWCLDVILSVF